MTSFEQRFVRYGALLPLVVMFVTGCRIGAPTAPPSTATPQVTTAEMTPTAGSSSNGEITQDEAIELARPHLADPSAAFYAASNGRMDDVYRAVTGEDQPAPGDPDRRVWAVEFATPFEVCGAEGSCETIRGFVSVFLDYSDGEWIAAASYSPRPGHTFPPNLAE